jgi:hypothetical protein
MTTVVRLSLRKLAARFGLPLRDPRQTFQARTVRELRRMAWVYDWNSDGQAATAALAQYALERRMTQKLRRLMRKVRARGRR